MPGLRNKDTNGEDDRLLWNSFQSGDRAAFEFIYQKYIHDLIRYGFKVTREKTLIEDCIQDLFIELWESRKTGAEVNSIKYYLFRSLRYKIIRHLKLNNSDDLLILENEIEADNFELQFLREETRVRNTKRLQNAIDRLPKRQREAIHLRYLEEMSNEEVARIMGVNYQSACKFIYTALKSLKEVMLSMILFFCS